MHPPAHTVARIIGESYNQHVRSMAPTDFWGQVRRHVFGRPIADDQIQLMLRAIQDALELQPADVLLDLACGNGALTSQLFSSCSGCLGVDVSEALIAVARRHFVQPGYAFIADDVANYVGEEGAPERFTKALCYGSFPYLHPASAHFVLATLASRFPNLERVFIGNLPDLNRMRAFYPGRSMDDPALWSPLSEIGIWRTPRELIDLAEAAGWSARISVMPSSFYAAHYRYDALLTRHQ